MVVFIELSLCDDIPPPSPYVLISCQSGVVVALIRKIPTMGCTWWYCSLSGLFVSGSRCLPYNRKLSAGLNVKLYRLNHILG